MNAEQFVESHLHEMIVQLCQLIRVPTVFDPRSAADQAPFGKGPAEGLEQFLQMAEAMGMKAVNYDGYAGEVTAGNGSYMIGILGHLDVVGVSSHWKTPPFEGTIKNGKIYGRGSSDDKGPLISCLYAMKYLQDSHKIPDSVSIRLIAGCDEEEGMRCISYYKRKASRLPDCAIVPDGYFPAVNCEKGLIDFDLLFCCGSVKTAPVTVLSLEGGAGRNIVPSKANCTIAFPEKMRTEILEVLGRQKELAVREIPGGCEITAEGRSVHAMDPDKGVNAVSKLLCGLKETGLSFDIQPFIDSYTALIGMDTHAEKLHCNFSDQKSGVLTFNIGTISKKGSQIHLEANLRYPVSVPYEVIRSALIGQLESGGCQYQERLYMPPLDIDKNSPFVQLLLAAYREITHDMEHDIFAIGGATYARELPQAVSFGPLFPYETEMAHEDNEYLSIESFAKMTRIYILALEKLFTAAEGIKSYAG